uniref:AAA+ ATPase domain-containing protein n=1 Tax=Corethron hystrix TaxID=216773 RepID=A0A7S1C1C2_9STRA
MPSRTSNGSLSNGNENYEQDVVDLHELAKGWKAASVRSSDPLYAAEARIKNDRGNLPLHTAASFRAPIEVAEILLRSYPEGASIANNYGNLALHFTAWKKGPLDVEKILLEAFPEGAARKNNHGNLPLHYAAHYNAPIEVVQALYDAYPEGAQQVNNDNNTPLDLAIADGASPNVVSLLQGKPVPPSEDELYEVSKQRLERVEQKLQNLASRHDDSHGDLLNVLEMLMSVKEGHGHSLFSAGIDPRDVHNLESLLIRLRAAGEEAKNTLDDESSVSGEIDESTLVPPDDLVEVLLSKIVGADMFKQYVRGLRRTIEMSRQPAASAEVAPKIPPHIAIVGEPGTGKSFLSHSLAQIFHEIGAVETASWREVNRDDLVAATAARTVAKARAALDAARGGVLIVDEPYTLLPSPARKRDHGVLALKEIVRGIADGEPLVVLTGYPADMRRFLSSDLGVRGSFPVQIELSNFSTTEIAGIFVQSASALGFTLAHDLTIESIALSLGRVTDETWRGENNGRVAEMMVRAVRLQVQNRTKELLSKSGTPQKSRSGRNGNDHSAPLIGADEISFTSEDIKQALTRM